MALITLPAYLRQGQGDFLEQQNYYVRDFAVAFSVSSGKCLETCGKNVMVITEFVPSADRTACA